MDYSKYIGHPSQICGVEEVTLSKGKGKGMTLLNIRNGKGLEFYLSADRAMDISRLSYKGDNMGYFSPCGYVAPNFYDKDGVGFLKSFTAGFLTTCGLTAVGNPCTDDGEDLPLHGTISNIPCENYSYCETDDEIIIDASVRDASLFGRKLVLKRKFICSKTENKICIEDCVENHGNTKAPVMLLYHFNMGYPLLSENAIINIPNKGVTARNQHAQEDIENALRMELPQSDYEERCYFYDVVEKEMIASVGIYNPDIRKGLKMSFDKNTLDYFVEWKMMGDTDYVLGLEPANCTPDGRLVMREGGVLKFIEPKGCYKTKIKLEFTECEEDIKC